MSTAPQAHGPASEDPRQVAYAARRAAQRAEFEAQAATGAFQAPFAPTHAPQLELGLAEPLRLADDGRAEAA